MLLLIEVIFGSVAMVKYFITFHFIVKLKVVLQLGLPSIVCQKKQKSASVSEVLLKFL